MIKKEGFKTVETDLEELEEKIHDHRKKIFKRIVITIIAVLAVFAAAQLWMALRSYDSYDIKNSVDQGDKSAVQFGTFCGNVIEYSNDGAVYMYGNGELIWNQAFEMASPHIEKCETYMAIYDKNGTVGGGPGGMYAAEMCAKRGHSVTLLEKATELGGHFLVASYPPGKGEISGAIRSFIVISVFCGHVLPPTRWQTACSC